MSAGCNAAPYGCFAQDRGFCSRIAHNSSLRGAIPLSHYFCHLVCGRHVPEQPDLEGEETLLWRPTVGAVSRPETRAGPGSAQLRPARSDRGPRSAARTLPRHLPASSEGRLMDRSSVACQAAFSVPALHFAVWQAQVLCKHHPHVLEGGRERSQKIRSGRGH